MDKNTDLQTRESSNSLSPPFFSLYSSKAFYGALLLVASWDAIFLYMLISELSWAIDWFPNITSFNFSNMSTIFVFGLVSSIHLGIVIYSSRFLYLGLKNKRFRWLRKNGYWYYHPSVSKPKSELGEKD